MFVLGKLKCILAGYNFADTFLEIGDCIGCVLEEHFGILHLKGRESILRCFRPRFFFWQGLPFRSLFYRSKSDWVMFEVAGSGSILSVETHGFRTSRTILKSFNESRMTFVGVLVAHFCFPKSSLAASTCLDTSLDDMDDA